MQWGSWSYRAVDHAGDGELEADEKDAETQRLYLSGRTTPVVGIVPLVATITAVLFFLLFLFMPRPWLPSDHLSIRHYGCGNSSTDAATAGCKFDVMSYTWVHPKCFDQQLMYEFLGASEWEWFGDEAGAQPLVLHEVAQGQHDYVYVTWEYYITHCTYMWRKMHRSLVTSRALDSYVSDYRHTEQCERVMLDRERELDSRSVMLVVKYPSCPVPT